MSKISLEESPLWQKYKRISDWHFDPNHDPSEKPFNTLCKFKGNWSEGIAKAVEECSETAIKVDHSKIGNTTVDEYEESELIALTGNDKLSVFYQTLIYSVEDIDADGKLVSIRNNDPAYTPFFKMIAGIGMYEPHEIRVTMQRLGQVCPIHLDYMINFTDKDSMWHKRYLELIGDNHLKLRRVFISLVPWQYGHNWQFGNSAWKGYDAGECISFDWKNMPHSTSNTGFFTRVNIQATGFVDEKFEWLLKNGSSKYIIDVD